MTKAKNFALYIEDLGKPQMRATSRNAIKFKEVEILPYTYDGRIRMNASFKMCGHSSQYKVRKVLFLVMPKIDKRIGFFKGIHLKKLNRNPIKAGIREFDVFAALL